MCNLERKKQMKKLLFMPIITMLFACSSNATLSVNEPLTYDVKIKDNAEFILVKEGTSVDEFTDNLESYLDIDTNADSYEIDWLGESLSTYTREDLKKLEGKTAERLSGMLSTDEVNDVDTTNKKIDIEKEIRVSKESTLNYDSFRPIELIIDFTKDGETETYYKQITLAVAREEEYNIISSNNIVTMEEAYRQIGLSDGIDYNPIASHYFTTYINASKEDGYFSNIRQH